MPGSSGLDDAAQVVVEQGNQSRLYTYLRDELGTVQSLVAENESTDPLHPTIAGRYAYSPYGEAHVESAPELLRAHIDADVTSANGTLQAISDPRLAASGALLLDWSAALDGTTLAAGVALETQVGGTWTALTGAEVAIALDASATRLTILPIRGWTASTSYRLRLTPSLHDTLGRALAANEVIELRTAAAPSTGAMPAVPFDRKTSLSYESWRAANDTLGNRFPGGQSHLFQGAWTDPVTGLAYHRARWYEARSAHWLSEDPAGTVDSVNLQAFVGWGPQGGRDPLGLALGDWWDPRSYGDIDWQGVGHKLWNVASLGTLERVEGQANKGTLAGVGSSAKLAVERVVNTVSFGVHDNLVAAVAESGELGLRQVGLAAKRSVVDLSPTEEIVELAVNGDRMSGGEIAVKVSTAVSKTAAMAASVAAAGRAAAVKYYNARTTAAYRAALGRAEARGMSELPAGTRADAVVKRWSQRNLPDFEQQFGVRRSYPGSRRGAEPDVLLPQYRRGFEYKRTEKAIRSSQSRAFDDLFCDYCIDYVFGKEPIASHPGTGTPLWLETTRDVATGSAVGAAASEAEEH